MFDVMAVGNALVDHEYLLTDEQLSKLPLTKGSMTLASEDEQSNLLANFKQQALTPSKQTGGGSAANAIFALSSLGANPFYACRVGDDESGHFYLQDLQAAGVTTADNSIADGVTGSCIVVVTPDGERSMQTFLGTSSDINEENIHFEALAKSKWLYLEGYLAMSDNFRASIARLRQEAANANTKIAVSFSDPAVVNFAKDGLLEMLGDGVDVTFCNVEEARLLTGEADIKKTAEALTQYTPLAVVTNGANDTVICQKQPNGQIHITTVPTPNVANVVDTNGAGDNYSGAFMYGLIQGLPITTCARLAGAVASQIIDQFGPRLRSAQYKDIAKRVL